MEKFLEAAKLAWNPIGACRDRVAQGNFTLVSMLVPYLGIVITCNLFAVSAQQFFNESLLYALGAEMPDSPILKNEFVFKFLAAFQVLLPLAFIAILPAAMFRPSTRSAILASVLAVAAAMAFYGAAFGVPIYVFGGIAAAGNVQLGLDIVEIASSVVAILMAILLLFFWFRITVSVLGCSAGKAAVILVVGAIPLAALIWLVIVLLSPLI